MEGFPYHGDHYHVDASNDAGENLYSIKWYKDQQEFYRSPQNSHHDVDEKNKSDDDDQ